MPSKVYKRLHETDTYPALKAHLEKMSNEKISDFFAADPKRAYTFSVTAPEGILLDYSKTPMIQETLDLLFRLAEEVGLREQIEAMFTGEKINTSEDRAVLHTALRNRSDTPVFVDGVDVMPEVNAVLARMRTFTDSVRVGSWKGYTGKAINDVVNIGMGGSDLGPQLVCDALAEYGTPMMRFHFVNNIDPTAQGHLMKQSFSK